MARPAGLEPATYCLEGNKNSLPVRVLVISCHKFATRVFAKAHEHSRAGLLARLSALDQVTLYVEGRCDVAVAHKRLDALEIDTLLD